MGGTEGHYTASWWMYWNDYDTDSYGIVGTAGTAEEAAELLYGEVLEQASGTSGGPAFRLSGPLPERDEFDHWGDWLRAIEACVTNARLELTVTEA